MNVTHTLQELNIGYNDIGDEEMAVILKALQHNRSLTTLKVEKCVLSQEGNILFKNVQYAKKSFNAAWKVL